MTKKYLLLMLFAISAGSASPLQAGTVYKCMDKAGKSSLRTSSCPEGTKQVWASEFDGGTNNDKPHSGQNSTTQGVSQHPSEVFITCNRPQNIVLSILKDVAREAGNPYSGSRAAYQRESQKVADCRNESFGLEAKFVFDEQLAKTGKLVSGRSETRICHSPHETTNWQVKLKDDQDFYWFRFPEIRSNGILASYYIVDKATLTGQPEANYRNWDEELKAGTKLTDKCSIKKADADLKLARATINCEDSARNRFLSLNSCPAGSSRVAERQNNDVKTSSPKKPKPTAPIKSANKNPVCRVNRSTAEDDLKASLLSRYKDSYSTVNLLYKKGMEAFDKLCKIPSSSVSDGVLSRLNNRYYPSFSTIELLYQKNMEAYRELNE